MAYIEENLKLMKQQDGTSTENDASKTPAATEEGMLKFGERYKTHGIELKEGSVGNSLAMLSAIPEVDLGMEYVDAFVHTFQTHPFLVLASAISKRQKRQRGLQQRRNELERHKG